MRNVKSGLLTVALVFVFVVVGFASLFKVMQEKNTIQPRSELSRAFATFNHQDVRDYLKKHPPSDSLTKGSAKAGTIEFIDFVTVRELNTKYRQQIYKLNDPYRRLSYVKFATVNRSYIWYVFDARTGEMLANGKRFV